MRKVGTILAVICCAAMVPGYPAFASESVPESVSESALESTAGQYGAQLSAESVSELPAREPAENTGEETGGVYVIYTSDIHCGIDQGFGFEGLAQVRDSLEARGYETILVDDGDAIQGERIGTMTDGEAIVDLMNEIGYDVAIPGNHEFDYGMDRFLELADRAEYQYISCNFTHLGELVFAPYVVVETAGLKIGFVGVTTPETLTDSLPTNFKNEDGEYVYGFMQDKTGEALYKAVQQAVDDVRAEGVDAVYLMGHMGMEESYENWSYAEVISHTNGIDVFLDGHSHDLEQVVMKNRDGENVVRSAVGTKLEAIGLSHISPEGEILETELLSWNNPFTAPEILNIRNGMTEQIEKVQDQLNEVAKQVVASSDVYLTTTDPAAVDSAGAPLQVIRLTETNLGDLCADAVLEKSGADIAVVNGGGIRDEIRKGDVTCGDIIDVYPFSNTRCILEVTGQQLLDALEWGAHLLPADFGGFLQVAGAAYEIHTEIPSGCTWDEYGNFVSVEGDYRVRNVMIGGEPLDLEKAYRLAGFDFTLLMGGDGFSMFDDAVVLHEEFGLDNQLLIDYITESLGGVIGEEYADPYGQGRITIVE